MFNPSPELLKKIGFNGQWVEMSLPTFDDVGLYAYVVRMAFSAIEENFKIGFDNRRLNTQLIGQVFGEAILNAAEHGNKRDPSKKVQAAFWLGDNGVLFGVRDQGNFFTKQSTKELIESRTRLKSTRDWGSGPSGLGLDAVFEADDLFVSTEENTLYLAVSAPSMIMGK